MPIHHALLALLTERESYGYELKSRFETVIGPQWGGLNIGHVYQVLDRLVRDDFATRERVAQDVRPDKHIYRITQTGRTELENWLASPHVRSGGYRDELFLKLFAAARLGDDALATVVAAQREGYLGELSSLTELRREHRDDPLVGLLVESAILHTQADLKITELAEQHLRGLAVPRESLGRRSKPARRGRAARTA